MRSVLSKAVKVAIVTSAIYSTSALANNTFVVGYSTTVQSNVLTIDCDTMLYPIKAQGAESSSWGVDPLFNNPKAGTTDNCSISITGFSDGDLRSRVKTVHLGAFNIAFKDDGSGGVSVVVDKTTIRPLVEADGLIDWDRNVLTGKVLDDGRENTVMFKDSSSPF